MNKRLSLQIVFLFIIAFLLFKNNIFKSEEVFSAEKIPHIFFLPHQDDEMFMAGAMKEHLEKKDDVYVVMVTDGSSSVVRNILNKKKQCDDFSEGGFGLKKNNFFSRKEFVLARNKEYVASMKTLGFQEDHILFANDGGVLGTLRPRYRDGHLSKEKASEVIKYFYHHFGKGVYITLATKKQSSDGFVHLPHKDHEMLSLALSSFKEIPDSNKQFFSESETENRHALSHDQQVFKKRALTNYFVCKPSIGRFAIGGHSVDRLLEKWMDDKFEYVVK